MRRLAAWRPNLVVLCAAFVAACDAQSTPPTTPLSCSYVVSPPELQPCMWATQLKATVTTDARCAWTATTDTSWIAIGAGASGSGPGTISLSVGDNWDAPRRGLLSIRGAGSATGQSVTVSQAGCYYSVSPASLSFTAAGGSASFDVLQQSDPNTCGGALQNACVWTAQSDSPWIVVTSGMPRVGDNPVRFTVAPNTAGAPRSGTIAVRDKAVRVLQSA